MQRMLLMLLLGVFVVTACEKEPEPEPKPESYQVDITVISPEENAVFVVDEPFTVKVQFDRDNDTIHNILVEVRDQEDVVVETLINAHIHKEDTYTYETELTLSKAGIYILTVITSDHGDQGIQRDVPFTVQ